MSCFNPLRLAMFSLLLGLLGMGHFAASAIAGPLVGYRLTLTVESVRCDWGCDIAPLDGRRFFGNIATGQTFVGGFWVDADILAQDGIVNTAPVFDFRLPFGNALYSTGLDNITLAGFRNQYGLGAIAPGFKVSNGNVVDLVGDVYGMADSPFIDFFLPTYMPHPNRFSAYDGAVAASGSLTVTRIPVPATLALLVFGLAGIFVSLAKRPKLRKVAA